MLKAQSFNPSVPESMEAMNRLLSDETVAFGQDYMKVTDKYIVIFYAEKKPEAEVEKKPGEEGYTFGLQKTHILGAIDKFISERQGEMLDAKMNLAIVEAEDAKKLGGKGRREARQAAMYGFKEKIRTVEEALAMAFGFIKRVEAGENVLALTGEFADFSMPEEEIKK